MSAQGVPTKAELQAWAVGKLDHRRRGEIEAYLDEHPERLADLESLPEDDVLRPLRGAKEVPSPPRRSLLELAIEAVVPVVAGCAGALAGGVEGGLVGVAIGQAAEKAINVFGGRIVNKWLEWLRRQPPGTQSAAVAELAAVPPEVARSRVAAALASQVSQASEADRRAAVEYLAAIPQAVRQSLLSDRRTLAPSVSVDDPTSLLRLLPASLPPYAAPCTLPGTAYRLEELIGTGGFGAVYRATLSTEQYLHRAIKFCLDPAMLPVLRRERENLERLIEAGGRSWSPRVVRLYGYDLEHATPYLVYEYVAGGDLVSWLERRRARAGRALTQTEALSIIVQVVEGLAFAHERGIVHRDLKPANVLIEDQAGKMKLADFGIGGATTQAARAGTAAGMSLFRGAGTPLYADPEQREGKAPDPRHDLYSLGVMWYQLLVGDVRREMRHGWERELEREAGVAREHVEALRRCVGWIEERPRDAGELLRLLHRPDGGEVPAPAPAAPAQAPPAPEGEPSPDELRRLLLLDLKDVALRLRYLAVRTPELRERDRREVSWSDFLAVLAIAVGFGLLAGGSLVLGVSGVLGPPEKGLDWVFGSLVFLFGVPSLMFGVAAWLERGWMRAQQDLGPLPSEWRTSVYKETPAQRRTMSVVQRLDALSRAAKVP